MQLFCRQDLADRMVHPGCHTLAHVHREDGEDEQNVGTDYLNDPQAVPDDECRALGHDGQQYI